MSSSQLECTTNELTYPKDIQLSPFTRVSSDDEDESFRDGAEATSTDETSINSRKRRMSFLNESDSFQGTGVHPSHPRSNKIHRHAPAWSHESHRAFVEAIYNIGLKQASPSVILEHMVSKHDCITSEKVKSHLQKYRKNHPKGKDEFLASYDEWIDEARQIQEEHSESYFSMEDLIQKMGSNSFSSGNMAAILTFSVVLSDCKMPPPIKGLGKTGNDSPLDASAEDYKYYFSEGGSLTFPDLSDKEKESSVGQALTYVQTMFSLLTDQLGILREALDWNQENGMFNTMEDWLALGGHAGESPRNDDGSSCSETSFYIPKNYPDFSKSDNPIEHLHNV
jgi:SHAQKYF class myb-like DNA-binding protein